MNIELIKSTRWPGNPEIGVHVVPAVWHDIRPEQTHPYTVGVLRPQVVEHLYNLFFRAPRQDVEVTSKNFSMQKLIGQARVQMRLLRIGFHATGLTVNPQACCGTESCDRFGMHMSWGPNLGDATAVDLYGVNGSPDLFWHDDDHDTGCQAIGLFGSGNLTAGWTIKDWGAINFRLESLEQATVVAHELAHLVLRLGHDLLYPNHLMDYPNPGFILPQSDFNKQSIEDGRRNLHCQVVGCPESSTFADPLRSTPDNRYLQLNTQPAPASP